MSKRKTMNLEKAKSLVSYVQIHGEQKTCYDWNMKHESLFRRLREIKSKWGITPQQKLQLPKILLFDIETQAPIFRSWNPYPKFIPHKMLVKDWCIICWSAKWLYEAEVHNDKMTPEESIVRNDERVVRSLWDMIDEADIIIAHNLKKFDKKKANSRFLFYKMNPPSHYNMVDTLEATKSQFGETYNGLDFLSSKFNGEGKLKTDIDLWIACDDGDGDAIDEMSSYCDKDVFILEDYYLTIRKWIKSHPNLSLYVDACEARCPNCGSANIVDGGDYVTPANRYPGFRCECGYAGRYPQSMLSTDKRKSLTRSVAR